MGSFSWIEYLKDPQLVASFQQYFGVEVPSYYNTPILTKCKCDLNLRFSKNAQKLEHSAALQSTATVIRTKTAPNEHQDVEDEECEVSKRMTTCKVCSEEDSKGNQTQKSKPIIGNKFWYFLFSFGTALGDEAFYAFSFCFWFWNVDGSVGRKVVYVWALLMYIGKIQQNYID